MNKLRVASCELRVGKALRLLPTPHCPLHASDRLLAAGFWLPFGSEPQGRRLASLSSPFVPACLRYVASSNFHVDQGLGSESAPTRPKCGNGRIWSHRNSKIGVSPIGSEPSAGGSMRHGWVSRRTQSAPLTAQCGGPAVQPLRR